MWCTSDEDCIFIIPRGESVPQVFLFRRNAFPERCAAEHARAEHARMNEQREPRMLPHVLVRSGYSAERHPRQSQSRKSTEHMGVLGGAWCEFRLLPSFVVSVDKRTR